MDSAIATIQSLAASATEQARSALIDKLRALQSSLETPHETLHRLAGLQLQMSIARTAVDLKLFSKLAESDKPLNVKDLAAKSGCDEELMGRICRYLASVSMIDETGLDEFTANNVTKTLAMDGVQGGIYHFHETVNPPLQYLPKLLRETGFRNIEDAGKTALQPAFNTELPGFVWFPSQPERFAEFQKVMGVQRSGLATWLDVYPAEKQLKSDHADIAFVDVGGGFGQQGTAVVEKVGKLEGRVVFQDLPQTLEHVPPFPHVEAMPYNFFEPQPLKNAAIYYLRNILHDWPDEASIAILKNQIAAAGPKSKILIDDMVIPNTAANWRSCQQDLTMMSSLGSRERTQLQWERLLEKAGLEIVKIYPYNTVAGDSVLECIPQI